MFVSFAASLHGHIGATEWLEHHLPKLKNRVVAYINLDAVVTGVHIDSTTSIPLKKLIVNAMKNVPDPRDPGNYEKKFYDFWKEQGDSNYYHVCHDDFCMLQSSVSFEAVTHLVPNPYDPRTFCPPQLVLN